MTVLFIIYAMVGVGAGVRFYQDMTRISEEKRAEGIIVTNVDRTMFAFFGVLIVFFWAVAFGYFKCKEIGQESAD